MQRSTQLLLTLVLSMAIGIAQAQVVINEFSASNYSDATDNYGEYEDWVELYNTTGATVDLSGYYLSDKLNNPTKWQFPSGVTIAANDHLVIWCSGRDEANFSGVHTNYKITQTKWNEGVILSDNMGNVIDSLSILKSNQTNHSTGRTTDGGATWGVFDNPNPGNTNTGSYAAYTAKPELNPGPGYFSGSVSVTITSPDAGATIYYTTNGDFPTTSSTVYSGPISLSNTTVIRAIAADSDPTKLISFAETNTYFVNDAHTIPVVSICGDQVDDLLGGNGWLDPVGSLEYFDENMNQWDETTGEFNKHGNDSWAYAQRGFDFIARDQFGYNHAIQHEIFPTKDRSKYQRLIVKAAANDNYSFEDGAHIRDAFLHHLSQVGKLKMDERSWAPAILYMNGQYWGVYDVREKVDDHDFTDYYYDQGKDEMDFIKTWGGTWAEYGSMTDWNQLYNYITTTNMAVQANYDSAKSRLNMGSLVDYMILNSWAVCKDWLNYNTAWWRGTNPDGDKKKYRYVLWDLDASFGHYVNYTGIPDDSPDADPCDMEDIGGWGDPQGHVDLLTSLLEADDFRNLYINRYAELNNRLLNCDTVLPFLDSMIAVIEPEMQRQITRWGVGTYAGWQVKVNELRTFISDRCASIDTGMVDCYNLEGPYNLTVIIDPPGSANHVSVHDYDPNHFPYSADYYGGVDVTLEATPDAGAGYWFDHWEINNNVLVPNTTDPTVSVDLSERDTVIAVFKNQITIPSYSLQVDVSPSGAGNAAIEAFTPPNYPYSATYLSGEVIDLDATANSGYIFDHWDLGNHFANPSISNPNISFILAQGDQITAHFKPVVSGADDIEQGYFGIYPTIVDQHLQIRYQMDEAFTLGIYDLNGQLIADLSDRVAGTQGEFSIDVDELGLASGAYFVTLRSERSTENARFVYMAD